MREGPGASQATAPVDSPPPENFEVINKIVLAMAHVVQEAIRCRYVRQLNNKYGAQACGCSQSEYQKRVTRGIEFAAGAFSFAA